MVQETLRISRHDDEELRFEDWIRSSPGLCDNSAISPTTADRSIVLTPASSPSQQPELLYGEVRELPCISVRNDDLEPVLSMLSSAGWGSRAPMNVPVDQQNDASPTTPGLWMTAFGDTNVPIGDFLTQPMQNQYGPLGAVNPSFSNHVSSNVQYTSSSSSWLSSHNQSSTVWTVPHDGIQSTTEHVQHLQHLQHQPYLVPQGPSGGFHDINSIPPLDQHTSGDHVESCLLPQDWSQSLIRPENEPPWTHCSVATSDPSRLATSHQLHERRTSKGLSRCSRGGAIVKPKAQHSKRSKVSFIQATSSRPLDASSPTSATSSITTPQRNGGRRSGPLAPENRERAAILRASHGACWICALHRNSCSEGEVCVRCADRLSRCNTHPLPCVRTPLVDMMSDFVSPKMTQVHNRLVIENMVKASMASWVASEGDRGQITVNMTVGYGPLLPWPMYEFVPRTRDVVFQLQWKKMPNGHLQCIKKPSPPLAIRTFDLTDEDRFLKFTDNVIENDLGDFEEIYCEDQMDDPFRANLMRLLCQLFRGLPNDMATNSLRSDIKRALCFIIATDIMLHQVTLDEKSKAAAISQLKLTPYNNPNDYGDLTSPRLVNRQLKEFVSKIQINFCEDVLRRLQAILRAGKGKKELTWLSSFILVLAMAMCLEETGHNRYLRADGDSRRDGTNIYPAIDLAQRDCLRADERFNFVMNVFNCKYSAAKRFEARFYELKGSFYHPAEEQFLQGLEGLYHKNCDVLKDRRNFALPTSGNTNIQPGNSNYDKGYKSRLVARFLVPFMASAPLDTPRKQK